MNNSKSKYFTTANRMDEALLELLEKKDFAYITVKEICKVARVNRSTFYLHYETMSDLLLESTNHMNELFLAYMKKDSESFIEKINDCSLKELYLITPEYLTPYLSYIKEYKRLFSTAMKNASLLGMNSSYEGLYRHVFVPILDRYEVKEHDRNYIMQFYIQGLMAIINEWLNNDCVDSIPYVANLIQKCVKQYDAKE